MEPLGQQALRVAVEGCGHGTLHAIYAATEEACGALGWTGVDVLIIGGDFQAVRNASDLTVMSCPAKYREIGDFHEYYSGRRTAPYLTIFVGGNHEASSHLWELYYGGWVAPNIFYMGAANVVRLGALRIAGMSGIWKGYNYNKCHYERLPYSQDDIKSIYHVRELDIRKLLQIRTQVDIGISHDWPRAIEKYGDERSLFRMKPEFEQESKDGTLGNQAATFVMDRLRPSYWFAAHMHCKFAALRAYSDDRELPPEARNSSTVATGLDVGNDTESHDATNGEKSEASMRNADEIDLDLDEDESPPPNGPNEGQKAAKANDPTGDIMHQSQVQAVPEALRAQLPIAFSKPAGRKMPPGQPCPPEIRNKQVKFLALDKCLPSRKFLQLLSVEPITSQTPTVVSPTTKHRLEYDPEWLAITRVFAESLRLGDRTSRPPPDLGEEYYLSLIQEQEAWVDEHVVKAGKLTIPENFAITAPAHAAGMPELVQQGPEEYNNPQMAAFCELLEMENKFFGSDEEKAGRMSAGPPPSEPRRDGAFGGGRHRSRGGRFGRGGGRGRGSGGDGGRGKPRGRGRGWVKMA